MNSFREACRAGRFVVTSEVGPPKGTDVRGVLEDIDRLKHCVHAINVTDNQSAVMRMGSLAVSHEVVARGGEPVFQLSCRDRNRLALQNDLLSAHLLGVRNVLCLTGDHPWVGDHKEAKPVYDFDSVHLIQCVRKLNAGADWAGNALQGSTDLFAGAVVAPDADPLEPQLYKLAKKVEAGAQFFQTQAVYDLEAFARFMRRVRELLAGTEVRVLAGLLVLSSAGMARYMNRAVPGIYVPDELVDEMACGTKEDAVETGVRICARHIRRLREEGLCDGVHIMAPGKVALVPRILEMAGLSEPG